MDISNDAQLRALFFDLAEEALSRVSYEVYKIFIDEYILGMAYISNPQQYQRTWEFMEAWDFTDIKRTINSVVTELWYDPSKMRTFNPEKFQHGSKYSSPPDIRDNLPSILEGRRSRLWISVDREKKFWQEFEKTFITSGRLSALMDKHMKPLGFIK